MLRLRLLREQLALAMRRQPPDRAACVRLKTEIRRVAGSISHQACCPFCGNQIDIPPRADALTICCRRCRNNFTFDPLTDQISVSRQPFQQNAQRMDYKWIALWLAIILAAVFLAALASHKPKIAEQEPAPVIKGEPASAIDEIRRELKALTE